MLAAVDTNVIVSGLFWRGTPHVILDRIQSGKLGFVSSPALMAELAEVLARPKFAPVIARSGRDTGFLLIEIEMMADIVEPPPLPGPVSRDPDDDALLALAREAKPDFIISGDRDILVLGAFAGIPILTPNEGLARVDFRVN